MTPAVLRLLFWAALAAVLVLSLAPVPAGHMMFSWQDKFEHAIAFLALGVLGNMAWANRWWMVALGLLSYGALIEVAQSLTAHRMGDGWDWLADAVGVGLASMIFCCRRRV